MTAENHDIVRAAYDVIADEYLRRVAVVRESEGVRVQVKSLIDEIRERVPHGGRAIDLGCGAGMPFTASLAEHFDVTGVDFSGRQIELAQKNVPGASFVQSDMTQVEFPDGEADVVTAFFSIIHVHRDLHAMLYQSIAAWLKPGGVFAASLGKRGKAEDWEDDWFGARMFWSYHEPDVALEQISNAGMRVERSWHETVEAGIDGLPETFFWVVASKA